MTSENPQTDQCGSQPDPAVGATAALAEPTHIGPMTNAPAWMKSAIDAVWDGLNGGVLAQTRLRAKEQFGVLLATIDKYVLTPTPPASTTLATGNEEVVIDDAMVERGMRALELGGVFVSFADFQIALTAALSPPAGGKGALVEITEEMVRDAYHAGYAMGGEDALNGVWRSDAWETSKTRAALTAALAPASDEVA